MTDLKDSGTRRSFDSGAVRDAAKMKGRFDLIPFWPQFAYASILEAGAKKYAANNWRKGMPISVYVNSAINHLAKYKSGLRDEPHLWQALWNIAGAVHTQIQIYFGNYPTEFNDLFSDVTLKEAPPLVGKYEILALEQFRPMIEETKLNEVVPETTQP